MTHRASAHEVRSLPIMIRGVGADYVAYSEHGNVALEPSRSTTQGALSPNRTDRLPPAFVLSVLKCISPSVHTSDVPWL